MPFKVILLGPARGFLFSLAAIDRRAAEELRLVLMGLGYNFTPSESRALSPDPDLLESVPGERVWKRSEWVITYKVDEEAKEVLIGEIEARS